MTQSLLEVRLIQFENAARDLAEQLGCDVQNIKLTVGLDEAHCIARGRQRHAELVHTSLQDQLDFSGEETGTDECKYNKGNTTISFQFE